MEARVLLLIYCMITLLILKNNYVNLNTKRLIIDKFK